MKFTLIYENGFWFVRSPGHHLARDRDDDSQRMWALQPNFPYGNINIYPFESIDDAKDACCEWMREQQYFAEINARVFFDATPAADCHAERVAKLKEQGRNLLTQIEAFKSRRKGKETEVNS